MRSLPFSVLLLLPTAYCGVCPDGYTQPKGAKDCFNGLTFYESFIGTWYSKSYDDAEALCNYHDGALLTSIHSDEENSQVAAVDCNTYAPDAYTTGRNIGLRCQGRDCHWDDGTALDYDKFLRAPPDDGIWRCYTILGGSWIEHGCGPQEKDCWICRVKARTIDCVEGETAYKGGCVYVYSPPIEQKVPSCPGGRLVSIHASDEWQLYLKIALEAGVNGTITIGGTFSLGGVFQWMDGSITTFQRWAYGFPNTIFGNCVQMLLDSEFGSQGQFTNIDCDVNQPYICIRDGTEEVPNDAPQAKADAKCPPIQYFSAMGYIYSPDYPLSIPGQQNCEYVIGTIEGSKASIKFASFDCQSGTTLSFFDGMNSNQPFKTFTTDSPELNLYYTSSSNVLKMVFSTNGTAAPAGTGWEAEFTGL